MNPRPDRARSPQERMELHLERSGGLCTWCAYDLSISNARPTRDHLVPKNKGGPTRFENEVASCQSCNGKRKSAPPSEWIEQCIRERGVAPNVQLVAEQLAALSDAIEREGGMRKIRNYVSRELKRVQSMQ